MSLISSSGPTDIINQPNYYYSWDANVITWKMSNEFVAEFPNTLLHEQVRLAFKEWTTASSNSNRYSWVRYNGPQDVCDLRTVMTHELGGGHVLGSQHPDASWYNNGYMKNFRLDNFGNWFAAPPLHERR